MNKVTEQIRKNCILVQQGEYYNSINTEHSIDINAVKQETKTLVNEWITN